MNLLHDIDWVLPWRSPGLTQAAFAMSWLGYATFIMFFMAVGYWVWNKEMFFRVMLLVTFSAVCNAFFKDLLLSPRPPLGLRLDDLVGESYGMPSGHAQMAVTIWFWLAYEIRRPWAWLLASTIVVGVCLSRIYLGAHDAADVLGGVMLGAATLFLFAQIKDRQWFWQTQTIWSLMFVLLVTAATLAGWPNLAKPPNYVLMLAGWIVGGILGLRYENLALGFSAPTSWWRQIIAALVGILAFLLLQKALKITGAALNPPAQAWEASKGLIISLFIAIAVPWLLARLRLVPSRRP